jgi:hypothetical protein
MELSPPNPDNNTPSSFSSVDRSVTNFNNNPAPAPIVPQPAEIGGKGSKKRKDAPALQVPQVEPADKRARTVADPAKQTLNVEDIRPKKKDARKELKAAQKQHKTEMAELTKQMEEYKGASPYHN